MEKRTAGRYARIYTAVCLILSNVLWYWGYSLYVSDPEHPLAMGIITLTSFLPAFTALVMTRITKEGWNIFPFHPHPVKAWKAYAVSVVFTLLLVYLGDPLYLLLFPGGVSYSAQGCSAGGWLQVGIMVLVAIAASVEMLGEELGWIGYLFPKLETLHGTKKAIVLMGTIRALWHLGILAHMEHPVIGFLDLCISNILCQSLLVYVTKKSHSLFPAAVSHGITMLVPVFLVYSPEFYSENILAMNLTGQLPAFVIGGVCWHLLKREKLISNQD